MGGGDLNLKKSWHPSTLRNIERVWKAEQKHEAEQQKIEQLQKELAEERSREEIRAFAQDQGVVKKKDERLEWMYQGPAAMVNREEYLMGRKVDKTFEILQQQESGQESKDNDSKLGAIFNQSSVNTTVDIDNKIREDPLFSIMKREKEERKSLLTNPVKMKKLQQMLQKSLSKDHKKKKNKKKQKRKHRHSTDSSDESSSDLDDNSSQREEKVSQSKGHHSRDHHRHEKASAYNTEGKRYHEDKMRYEEKVDNKYHRNEYKRHRENSSFERKSSRLSNYPNAQNSSNRRDKNDHRKPSEHVEKVDGHATHRNEERREKKKLSEEEKESLRQAMMMKAKWRDEQRQKNVKRYKEDDERENDVDRRKNPDFIRVKLSKAAEKGSIAGRVKQKIFTIQRNPDEMDRNFAKR